MSTKSSQTKAGKLLSKFVRQISEEETECLLGEDGNDRMVTKAEALARIMWDAALGKDIKETDEQGAAVTIRRRPDKGMMALLYDRMEGKSPIAITDSDDAITIAEKVTEQGKNRITQAGGLSDTNS